MKSKALSEVDRLAVLTELILDELGNTAKTNIQTAMDNLTPAQANNLVRRNSNRQGVQTSDHS